jgi:predicted transcriptional regulator
MPVTSVRLTEALKRAVDEIATAEGRNAHAFMVEAIEEKLEAARLRLAFVDEAKDALAQVDAGGPLVDEASMHAWIRERAAGRAVAPPSGKRPPRRGARRG